MFVYFSRINLMKYRWKLFLAGINNLVLRSASSKQNLPKSSVVLEKYLKQRSLPSWTAFYVPQSDVQNDLWGQSHFNFKVDEKANYHVLRTGAFPFIKFHCTQRPEGQDLSLENHFYNVLKVLNFGFPCFLYGIAGLLWANHIEEVKVEGRAPIKIYFWYRETH